MTFAAAMHLKVQPRVSKATGKLRSPAALIAYRFGIRLVAADGSVHDFRRKRDILSSTIVADHEWALDPQALAEQLEKANCRKNAQLGRELRLDISRHVPEGDRLALVLSFVHDEMRRDGIAYTVAIHNPPARDGGRNPHVHVYWDDRPTLADGRLGSKIRRTKDENAAELARWRAAWARHQNLVLERHGNPVRLSHLSYAAQGITDRQPEIKLGVAGHRARRALAHGRPIPGRYQRRISKASARWMQTQSEAIGRKYSASAQTEQPRAPEHEASFSAKLAAFAPRNHTMEKIENFSLRLSRQFKFHGTRIVNELMREE